MKSSQEGLKRIKKEFKDWFDKEFRDGYIEAAIEQGPAWQIRINRKKRGWSQEKLADKAGISVARLDMLEDESSILDTHYSYYMDDLVNIAKAFDCALMVKFVPFSQLVEDGEHLSMDDQYAPSFIEEVSWL